MDSPSEIAWEPKNPLVGTWKLLSREDVTASGERRTEPILGSNPIAYLIYDAAGNFAVQFMKRDRESGQAKEVKQPAPPITAEPSTAMMHISAAIQLDRMDW